MPVWQLPSKVYVCLDPLPTSIEAYLEEAGFSGTEIIVLKKLLEEDALTLRELASKTGKSTGVLDQAVKKLLKKQIIARISVNKSPKYTLHSLQSVVEWMENDMRAKQSMLTRRHEDFQSFVTSLTVEKVRPEMEYFVGIEGIKQVYNLLLKDSEEMLHYMPARFKEEEDPLSEFREEFLKERKKKGAFSRIISEDTPLGRRFQSRDDFNFRTTLLVPSDRYPFFIEQIISGENIAYIDHEHLKSCILRFANLAHYDSLFFEADWNAALHNVEKNIFLRSNAISELPSA